VAARAQLAALRAQVQPHFLFNALHTVVQLIPIDPKRAVEAAELVADLLRTTLEEQREEVTLGDEWRFVSRYLAVERIRFGDRLLLREDVPTARPAMGRRRTRVATRVRAARKDSSTDQRSWDVFGDAAITETEGRGAHYGTAGVRRPVVADASPPSTPCAITRPATACVREPAG
jgi:hypothetical protein